MTLAFVTTLEKLINDRKTSSPEASYTATLFHKGAEAIAQKVGEEAVEVLIEGLRGDPKRLCEESADLLFHLMILLSANNLSLNDVVQVLEKRHQQRS